MEYKVYTTKTYQGKYALSVTINDLYFTDIKKLEFYLSSLELIADIKEFKKIKSLKFTNENDMNEAKDYIESILIMGKLFF